MKKSYLLIFLFLCLLASCNSSKITPTNTPVASKIPPIISVISTSVPIHPTATQTIPTISLSKIHEWKGGYPLNVVWFKKSNQFVMRMEKTLDVYDTSMNLIWSIPIDRDKFQLDNALAVSSDDKIIVAYDNWQNGIILLDSKTGKMLEKSGRNDCVNGIFTENMLFIKNNLLLGLDGETDKGNRPIEIRSWNLSPLNCNKRKITIPVQQGDPSFIYNLQTDPDEKYFIAVFAKIIRVWDSQSFEQVCEIPGWYATFRPSDGKLAVINVEGNTVSFFDIESCSISRSFSVPSFHEHQTMEFTKDGKYLVFIRQGFQIFDADTGGLAFDDKSNLVNLVFSKLQISPDGEYLISTHADHGPVTALWKLIYK